MNTVNEKLNGQFVDKSDLVNLPANVEFYAGEIRDGRHKITIGSYLGQGNTELDFEYALKNHAESLLNWANEKLFTYEAATEEEEFKVEGKEDGWYDCDGNMVYDFNEFPQTVEGFIKRGSTGHHYDVTGYGIVAKWEEEN